MEENWTGIKPYGAKRDIWDKVKEVYQDTPIRILEIGVYRAGQIRKAFNKGTLHIKEYIGVDPYLGDSTDFYTKSYWQNEVDCFRIYKSSKEIFEKNGGILYKTTSEIFYNSLGEDEYFDVIYVDGCHTFEDALWDMSRWFSKLRCGGMLIVDDYGNSDTPDVTRAMSEFIKLFKPCIDDISFERVEFVNAGKYIPISLEKVFIIKGEGEFWHPKKLALWGTGEIARAFINDYDMRRMDLVVDDDVNKQGKEFAGIEVKSIYDIEDKEKYLFVLANGFYNRIRAKLTDLGLEEKNYISWKAFRILEELLVKEK